MDESRKPLFSDRIASEPGAARDAARRALKMRLETIAVHAGAEIDPATGALPPPLHLSTTFEHGPAGQAIHGFLYAREKNPTQLRLEAALRDLVAAALLASPAVEAVYYPGLPSHPGNDIARKQMTSFGGMLSFLVRGTREDALRVASRVNLFVNATSLGGPESLIEHRASSEGKVSNAPGNMLRLSVGLEHSDDLIEDLLQALA